MSNKGYFVPSKTCSHYGFGTINYSDLKKELSQHGGQLLIHVVAIDADDGDPRLKYGLFYQDKRQRVFDVVARSTCQLKTYFTSDTVLKAASELAGNISFPIPMLIEKNIVKYGELR